MTRALPGLRALLLVLAVLLLGGTALAADYPPRPSGPIYDGAGILSPATKASLDEKLRDYDAQTGRAIIVATIPTTDGEPIESYATGLFADWGIGGAKRDTGLLLLIAKDDRKLRIEVGYGLHPWFGGIMSGRVINDVIVPRFKEGDFDGGVTQGVDAIIQHLDKSPEDAAAIEEAAKAAEADRTQSDGGFPFGALFWFAFVFFFFILPAIRGGRRRRRFGGGLGNAASNIVLWEVGKAAARGLSDGGHHGGWGGGFGGGGGGGGGFGGFGGGMSGGGGASGGW